MRTGAGWPSTSAGVKTSCFAAATAAASNAAPSALSHLHVGDRAIGGDVDVHHDARAGARVHQLSRERGLDRFEQRRRLRQRLREGQRREQAAEEEQSVHEHACTSGRQQMQWSLVVHRVVRFTALRSPQEPRRGSHRHRVDRLVSPADASTRCAELASWGRTGAGPGVSGVACRHRPRLDVGLSRGRDRAG